MRPRGGRDEGSNCLPLDHRKGHIGVESISTILTATVFDYFTTRRAQSRISNHATATIVVGVDEPPQPQEREQKEQERQEQQERQERQEQQEQEPRQRQHHHEQH